MPAAERFFSGKLAFPREIRYLYSMGFSWDNIRSRLNMMPMAAVAVPLAVGIVFSDSFAVPPLLWLAAAAVSVAAAIFAVRTGRKGAYAALCAALFSAGALRMSLDTPPQPPYGEPRMMTLRFDEPSVVRGRSSLASARIVRCEDFDFGRAAARLTVWGDSTMMFSRGDEIVLRGVIRPFDRRNGRFADMAFRRGTVGSVSLYGNAVCEFRPAKRNSLHDKASAKLCRLLPDDDARSTILSMTTGERNRTNPELRRTYARGGAAHLLAVSGLHVGIVFMLVNALLRLVPVVRHGNVWRSISAVAAVWFYVAMCDSPPSAVRAGAMFTVLQLSVFSSRAYSGMNALAVAAAAMLLVSPRLVFDVGFRLSFIAVAAILLWGMPLYMRVRSRSRVLNALSSTLIIGVVATATTMPLISNVFGTVSVVGIPLNPLVVLSANAIIFSSVAALLLPSSAAAYAVMPAYWCARLQNEAVARAAALPWGCFEWRLSDGATAAVYALFVAATVAAWGIRGRR